MNFARLRDSLKHHEGKRLKAYKDTVGVLTIGYGRNLEGVGISEEEAEFLLDNDMRAAYLAAKRVVPTFPMLTDARQEVIVEMVFNLGEAGLRGFRKTLDYIAQEQWSDAAREMLDSQWARQVGQRATRLSTRFAGG